MPFQRRPGANPLDAMLMPGGGGIGTALSMGLPGLLGAAGSIFQGGTGTLPGMPPSGMMGPGGTLVSGPPTGMMGGQATLAQRFGQAPAMSASEMAMARAPTYIPGAAAAPAGGWMSRLAGAVRPALGALRSVPGAYPAWGAGGAMGLGAGAMGLGAMWGRGGGPERAEAALENAIVQRLPYADSFEPMSEEPDRMTPPAVIAPPPETGDPLEFQYEIQHGDTLAGIAARYLGEGASHAQIMAMVDRITAANKIADRDKIAAGASLNLPLGGDAATAPGDIQSLFSTPAGTYQAPSWMPRRGGAGGGGAGAPPWSSPGLASPNLVELGAAPGPEGWERPELPDAYVTDEEDQTSYYPRRDPREYPLGQPPYAWER